MTCVLATQAGLLPRSHGKVRDVYDLGDCLVLVATDRISAFDRVLPNGVPDKGKVLTGISLFWFRSLGEPCHLISTDLAEMGPEFAGQPQTFAGRSMLVRKARVVPIECVVRGYLAGSGWKEYERSGSVCGQRLPAGLVESDRLAEPIFTPATKAAVGHDENISHEQLAHLVGHELAGALARRSLAIYERGLAHARSRGIILADTKIEFGHTPDGELIVIDELLTPDSSRFWPADQYRPGGPQPSFDKQLVRDWLESVGYDKESAPPPLPAAIVQRTREKYCEAFERLTATAFSAYLAAAAQPADRRC